MNEPWDEQQSLHKTVLALVKERPLMELYTETKLPFFWLRSLREGRFKSPSVNRMQYLYEKLTGTKLIEG